MSSIAHDDTQDSFITFNCEPLNNNCANLFGHFLNSSIKCVEFKVLTHLLVLLQSLSQSPNTDITHTHFIVHTLTSPPCVGLWLQLCQSNYQKPFFSDRLIDTLWQQSRSHTQTKTNIHATACKQGLNWIIPSPSRPQHQPATYDS